MTDKHAEIGVYTTVNTVRVIVHEPYTFFITSRGTKRRHVFQQAYHRHTTYLSDSNQDIVAASILNFKMAATI